MSRWLPFHEKQLGSEPDVTANVAVLLPLGFIDKKFAKLMSMLAAPGCVKFPTRLPLNGLEYCRTTLVPDTRIDPDEVVPQFQEG